MSLSWHLSWIPAASAVCWQPKDPEFAAPAGSIEVRCIQTLLPQPPVLTAQQSEYKRWMGVDQLQKTLAIQTQSMHRCDGLGSTAVASIIRHQVLVEKHLAILVPQAITAVRGQLHNPRWMAYNAFAISPRSNRMLPVGSKSVHIAVFSDQLNSGRHGLRGLQHERQQDIPIVANASTL